MWYFHLKLQMAELSELYLTKFYLREVFLEDSNKAQTVQSLVIDSIQVIRAVLKKTQIS